MSPPNRLRYLKLTSYPSERIGRSPFSRGGYSPITPLPNQRALAVALRSRPFPSAFITGPARLSNTDKIARAYLSIRVLPYARDRARTADAIRNMDAFDAAFCRGAIMSHGMRATSAFRTLYDL